jgi:hypothetical protein
VKERKKKEGRKKREGRRRKKIEERREKPLRLISFGLCVYTYTYMQVKEVM